MSGSSSWADLPIELLDKISKCLDTEIESRLFRAVCKSWRSSTAPFKKFPPTPLNLPFPFKTPHGWYMSLTERTIYRLQQPDCGDPNFWLVEIETSNDGKSRVLNPVSHHEIELLPQTQMPKVLNTSDFRVSEVCKSYALHYVNPSKPKDKYRSRFTKKVAVSVGPNNDEYVIAAIDYTYHLWYIKSSDLKWRQVRVRDDRFILDIVNYKGQFYGVDTCGGIWLFDSMFKGKMITFTGTSASKRHLMEFFDGHLVLVDEVTTDENKRACNCYNTDDGCYCYFPTTPVRKTVEQIRVYRMDKRGEQSVKAKLEFDGFIFVGCDCSFSVSAEEFKKGCKRIRVSYLDPRILFPTEEEKTHFHNFNGDNYFECDCWYSSDEEDTGMVDNFIPSDDVNLMFRGLDGHIPVCLILKREKWNRC